MNTIDFMRRAGAAPTATPATKNMRDRMLDDEFVRKQRCVADDTALEFFERRPASIGTAPSARNDLDVAAAGVEQ